MRFQYFALREFFCKCCGASNMSLPFVRKLDDARAIAGVPFVITSGYRCAAHNAKEGGAKNSAHLYGLAADISAPNSATRLAIVDALLMTGFTRLGIGKTFVHVDDDLTKPQRVMWTY